MRDVVRSDLPPPRCPACGSCACVDCGPPAYHRPTRVAGVPIDVTDLPLRHMVCSQCTYRFIHPEIPAQRLLDCYRRAPQGHWGTDQQHAETRFYDRKKQLLEQYAPGRRVLDFGCFDGGFLEYLGDQWDRAGIEPSEPAARVAESRGIPVLGRTVEALRRGQVPAFDAIVVLDVMEHLGQPVSTLAALSELLKDGGILLIETGDSDSSHFRRVGKLYPYCGLVEHVGFFNRASIARAAERAGLQLVHFEPSIHSTYLRDGALAAWFYVAAYWMIRLARGLGLPLPANARNIADGPVPRTIEPRDHFLAVLQRVENSTGGSRV